MGNTVEIIKEIHRLTGNFTPKEPYVTNVLKRISDVLRDKPAEAKHDPLIEQIKKDLEKL